MAIGMLKSNSLFAVTEESAENTPVDPTLSGDFIEVLEDGIEFVPAKELIERNTLSPSIGTPPGRTTIKTWTSAIPLEWKTSGVEGTVPRYDVLMRSTLGGLSSQTSQTTTGIGTTTSVNLTTHPYAVGDYIVIQTAGEFHPCFVKEITDADNFVIFPAAPNAIGSGVTISASNTYFPTNSGQITFTPSMYWANEIKEQGSGGRVASLAVENFTVGQIPNLNFSSQGLNFTRVDGAAPLTPTFDSNLPPVVLGAVVSDGDGNCIDLSEFSLTVENTISNLNSVCPIGGVLNSRYTQRGITGTMNPYTDDTTVKWFDFFNQDTLFSLSLTLGIHSSTAGELVAGSTVSLYLPTVQITEVPVNDLDGVLVDAISFNAHTSVDGSEKEVFFGFS